MALDPWSYAAKTRNEHAEQVALFMWANMALNFGVEAANDPKSYNVPGYAIERWGIKGFASRYNEFKGKSEAVFSQHGVGQLKWLHAIHNQGNTAGEAGRIHGGRAKAEGLKAGVSDIFLPVPVISGPYPNAPVPYHGFYIELKRKDSGTPSADQLEFQSDMQAAGYKCEIIHGWELARDAILAYLGVS